MQFRTKLYEFYFQPLSLFIGVQLWAREFVFYYESFKFVTLAFFNGVCVVRRGDNHEDNHTNGVLNYVETP